MPLLGFLHCIMCRAINALLHLLHLRSAPSIPPALEKRDSISFGWRTDPPVLEPVIQTSSPPDAEPTIDSLASFTVFSIPPVWETLSNGMAPDIVPVHPAHIAQDARRNPWPHPPATVPQPPPPSSVDGVGPSVSAIKAERSLTYSSTRLQVQQDSDGTIAALTKTPIADHERLVKASNGEREK